MSSRGEDRATGTLELGREHQGATGIAHGGWVYSAFGDILGGALVLRRVVTLGLEVRYRRPTPTGVVLDVASRVVNAAGRDLVVTGEIGRGDEVLATAWGEFRPVDRDHLAWRWAYVTGREVP